MRSERPGILADNTVLSGLRNSLKQSCGGRRRAARVHRRGCRQPEGQMTNLSGEGVWRGFHHALEVVHGLGREVDHAALQSVQVEFCDVLQGAGEMRASPLALQLVLD